MSIRKIIVFFIIININIPSFIVVSSSQVIEDDIRREIDQWIEWAKIAWRYFEPGVGVDRNTGLHKASIYWSGCSDWDLGGYLITILHAEKIGLIKKEGEWGADRRIEKVLEFLEKRELTWDGIPYWGYDTNGKPLDTARTNPSDSGRLLIALYLIKKYKPYFSSRIDYIVYKKHNFRKIAMDNEAWKTTGDFYAYYVAHGFKFFGFGNYTPVANALNFLNSIRNREKVDVYGIKLPKASIIMEPLLHIIFELEPNEEIMQYTYNAYLAQELRYKNTKRYTAWSEGNAQKTGVSYVYEWIVYGDGSTWKITPEQITPITYIKAAIGMHALFNTDYTKDMVDYIIERFEVLDLSKGFYEGIDDAGEIVLQIIDKTNTLIIEAAYYAIRKLIEKTYRLNIQENKKTYSLGEEVKIELLFSGMEPPFSYNRTLEIELFNKKGIIDERKIIMEENNYTLIYNNLESGPYILNCRVITNYNGYNSSIINSTKIFINSAQVSSIAIPLIAAINTSIKILANIEYYFPREDLSIEIPLKIQIIDRENNQTLAINQTLISNEKGIIPIVFYLNTPNIEKDWKLSIETYYNINNEWMYDKIPGWRKNFNIEIKKENITQTEIYVVKYETIKETIIKTTTKKYEITKTVKITETLEYSNNLNLIIALIGILTISSFLLINIIKRKGRHVTQTSR